MSSESKPLNVEQAAAYLAVTPRWIRRAVEEGRLPYYKVGHFLRFSESDLAAYLEAQRHEAATR